ncbi:hypothetical protein BASA81_005184 [Batrachochytrium salamandrivorans]|nr:hypothetical protein BASA81_005184 [Batrachochytrium salamandrivorans]
MPSSPSFSQRSLEEARHLASTTLMEYFPPPVVEFGDHASEDDDDDDNSNKEPPQRLRRRMQTTINPNTAMSKNSFIYAANRLGKLITTKHVPAQIPSSLKCLGLPDQALPSTVQDLFILVEVTAIDGVSNTLGQAGPCISDGNGFPRVGYVQFDVADVEDMIRKKTFDAVCLHEISHILGFGTLWDQLSLVQNQGTSDPRYKGTGGIRGMNQIAVGNTWQTSPVQNTGGAGTAGSHWRDTNFGYEMMTAYLDQAYQPYSAMTVESLTDLGYTVDSSAFDVFSVNQTSGYPVPPDGSGPKSDMPVTWTTMFGGGLNSTEIWIMSCLLAAFVVLLLSCLYSWCRRRRALPPSQPTSSGGTVTQPSSAPPVRLPDNIPVAVAVPVIAQDKLNMFQDFTQCYDPNVAYEFLARADGNVQIAVNRYLQGQHGEGVAMV